MLFGGLPSVGVYILHVSAGPIEREGPFCVCGVIGNLILISGVELAELLFGLLYCSFLQSTDSLVVLMRVPATGLRFEGCRALVGP